MDDKRVIDLMRRAVAGNFKAALMLKSALSEVIDARIRKEQKNV